MLEGVVCERSDDAVVLLEGAEQESGTGYPEVVTAVSCAEDLVDQVASSLVRSRRAAGSR